MNCVMSVNRLIEDDLTPNTGSRDQYGGPSTGSRSCGRSTRGRRQKPAGQLGPMSRLCCCSCWGDLFKKPNSGDTHARNLYQKLAPETRTT